MFERENILQLLKQNHEILEEMGVMSLALFGSVARGEANAKSDLDILVDFGSATSFDAYMDLKFYLEDLLQCEIDLITLQSVRPQIRPTIEQDAIYVA